MSNRFLVKGSACLLIVLACSFPSYSQRNEDKQNLTGYLDRKRLPDLNAAAPLAPTNGDERDGADRALFKATRSWEGTERWTLAQQDNDLSVNGLLHAFSCALGWEVNAQSLPALRTLLSRIAVDSGAIDDAAKHHYQRLRPFLVQPGPICIDRSPSLIKSFDYPSGHTTLGWLTGLVLADLLPHRAPLLLARARAYGESRWICGVHNASAVAEGRTLGSAIFALLNALPDFQTDLEKARVELAAEVSQHLTHVVTNSCIAEQKLIAADPYKPPQPVRRSHKQ